MALPASLAELREWTTKKGNANHRIAPFLLSSTLYAARVACQGNSRVIPGLFSSRHLLNDLTGGRPQAPSLSEYRSPPTCQVGAS